MVEAVARVTQTPESIAACCALATISASIGKGLAIRSATLRLTRANIFVLVVARSGEGKSECFRPVLRPLLSFEQTMVDNWQSKTRPKLLAMKVYLESQIGKMKAQARKDEEPLNLAAFGEQLADVMSLKEQCDARLSAPSLVCDDVTTERLAVLLAENREVIFSASSDAGAALNNLLGRYSRQNRTQEDIYLKGYCGDLCRVGRIGRKSVALKEPCLTLLWLVQPDKVDDMFNAKSLSDGGMLPRVMVCQADGEPTPIDRTIGGFPPQLENDWRQLIYDLLETYHQRLDKTFILEPSEHIIRILDAHQHRVVARRREELADTDSFAARWNEWAWRLTVILHAATHGVEAHEHPVSEATATAATGLADWFADQQLQFLEKSRAAAKGSKEQAVFDLLNVQAKKQPKVRASITARDVLRARVVMTSIEARTLLRQMEADGKLEGRDIHSPQGGHAVRRFWKAPQYA